MTDERLAEIRRISDIDNCSSELLEYIDTLRVGVRGLEGYGRRMEAERDAARVALADIKRRVEQAFREMR